MKNQQNQELEAVKKEILDSFIKVNETFIGNVNSLHKLGTKSKKLEMAATSQILDTLNLKNKEVIYTSGLCEANNLALYGLLEHYTNKDKKIIATETCETSVLETLKSLEKEEFEIEIVNNFDNLNLNNTILVCFSSYEEYSYFISKYKDYSNHILLDITKEIPLDKSLEKIDFLTFDLSKYDLYGIGVLIKSTNVIIEPLFKGGKSTTIYRSGTPALPLITIFSKYLRQLYKK